MGSAEKSRSDAVEIAANHPPQKQGRKITENSCLKGQDKSDIDDHNESNNYGKDAR